MEHTRTLLVVLAVLSSFVLGCGEQGASSPTQATPMPSSSGEQVTVDDSVSASERTPTPAPVASVSPERGAGLAAPPPELLAVDGLRLRRLALSRSVESREPVDPSVEFQSEAAPLFAFVDVANETDNPAEVVVTFESPSGRSVGHVTLGVPASSPRWRTWARSHMITEPGSWTAVVRTVDGSLLGRMEFTVHG